MNYKVYLAGPITGLDYKAAVTWRKEFAAKVPDVLCFSPMRGKENLVNEKELSSVGYDSSPMSTSSAIYARDRYDVESADMIVVNLLGAKTISIGTMFEMAWASLLRKPIILVMESGNIHRHAFVYEAASVIVPSLEKAAKVVETFYEHEEAYNER